MEHNYEDLKEYWQGSNDRGYQKLIAEKKFLHENSVFLVQLLRDKGVLEEINYAFEMGCGCARNLAYLYKARPDVEIGGDKGIVIGGNDLSSAQCFKYMDEAIKEKIIFFEKDSKLMVDDENIELHLFMSIDHLMHLDVETVEHIMRAVQNSWEPKYILLRNSITDRLKKRRFVYLHDFSYLEETYDLIEDMRHDNFKVLLLQ